MGEVPVIEDFSFLSIKFIKIGVDNGEAFGYQLWFQFLGDDTGVVDRGNVDSV